MTYCSEGHPLTGKNLFRRKNGTCVCRLCQRNYRQRLDIKARETSRRQRQTDERWQAVQEEVDATLAEEADERQVEIFKNWREL